MPPSTRPPGSHRERLLEAARVLLRKREYAAITARDLVAASDTNLGSIGYHFGSKDALLDEAIGLALEEWSQATLNAVLDEGHVGLDTLSRAVQMILEDHGSVRPYYQAFVATLSRCAQSPELKRQLADHYKRQRARLTATVAQVLNSDPDSMLTRDATSVVIALVDGLMIQYYVAQEDAPSSIALPAVAGVIGSAFQRQVD